MAQLPLLGLAPLPLYALTLHQPWLWSMTTLPAPWRKGVENRPWPPPRWLLGRWIALHAGLYWDPTVPDQIRATLAAAGAPGDLVPPDDQLRALVHPTRQHVVALARFDSLLPPSAGPVARWHFAAEYGWTVGDLLVLPQPVQVRGYQKLWRVREPWRSEVLAQVPPAIADALACA